MLFASGLIAGGAIAGLLVAVLAGLEASSPGPDGVPRPESLLRHLGLVLSERWLGPAASAALVANACWTLAPFLVLAIGHFLVAARREEPTRRAPRAGSAG